MTTDASAGLVHEARFEPDRDRQRALLRQAAEAEIADEFPLVNENEAEVLAETRAAELLVLVTDAPKPRRP